MSVPTGVCTRGSSAACAAVAMAQNAVMTMIVFMAYSKEDFLGNVEERRQYAACHVTKGS
jgi:hypothetical protein